MDIKKQFAQKLMDIKAIKLQPKRPVYMGQRLEITYLYR